MRPRPNTSALRAARLYVQSHALGIAVFVCAAAGVFGGFARFGGHPHAGASPGVQAQPLGGFRIAVPIYTLAPWDPSRIASFSFRLTPADRLTAVEAGVVPPALADSCHVDRVTRDTATVTCSYDRARAPRVRDAVALTVVASH